MVTQEGSRRAPPLHIQDVLIWLGDTGWGTVVYVSSSKKAAPANVQPSSCVLNHDECIGNVAGTARNTL